MRRGRRTRQTLVQFALKGSMTVYQLWKSVPDVERGPRSAYQKAVNLLQKTGFLTVKEIFPWFGNRTKKIHQLSLEGLLFVLNGEDLWIWESIEGVVKANLDLAPEYFELWDTFKKLGVNDVAVKLFRFAAHKLVLGVPTYPEQLEGRTPNLKDWLVRASIYPEVDVLTKKEHMRWLNAVVADERIYQIYHDTIKWMYESHKATSETWRKALEVTEKAKSWTEAKQRLNAIVVSIQDPHKRLKALKEDKGLWQKLKEIYDAEDDEELTEKMVKEFLRKKVTRDMYLRRNA